MVARCKASWGFDSARWRALPLDLKDLVLEFKHLLPSKPMRRSNDTVEVFAGKHHINDACADSGLNSTFFDILTAPNKHDIKSGFGLKQNILTAVYCLRRSGVVWGGPPCKSWVFINRIGAKRTQFSPPATP